MVIFVLTSVSNNPSHLELFNTPTVIAHRGGGDYAPENTISGIEMGIDLGADSVEFDVRFTVDGVPILMHDSTLGRTTNDTSNRAVNTVTLAEIKELDAGSWFSEDYIGEQVPTLAEALEVIGRNIDIFIELKADYENSAEIIVQIIEEASVESQVKVISFNSNTLEQMKAENERIETLLLISSFIGDINTLVNKDYVDDYGFYYSVISNNSLYVRTLQQAGKDVYVWTVNDEAVLLEMINLNVDGIITDKPLLTRELVYGDSKKSEFTKLLELLFIRN